MTNSINKNTKIKNSGYTLIETIFYITFFAILSVVVIDAILVMGKSFKETSIQQELAQSSSILERISREIKQANDINSINANSLELKTKDEAGADKTVKFLFSGTNIELLENGATIGNLNGANIEIVDLNFTQINTNKGKAVKVFLTVSSLNDNLDRTENFYDTVILRGKYQN